MSGLHQTGSDWRGWEKIPEQHDWFSVMVQVAWVGGDSESTILTH